MGIEAMKKYCGLLMFDVPTVSTRPQTSKNNDIVNNVSTRKADSSPPSYESSRNSGPSFVNNLDSRNQPFMVQEASDFCTTSYARAAGAAAGDDDLDSFNANNDDDTSRINGSSQKRTPRPPNAFILYRKEKQPAIIASHRHLTNAEVSRKISDMWKGEPEETRLKWERYADLKKLEHLQTYPNYVYRPNKGKSKVDKRRQRKSTSSTVGETSADYKTSTVATGGPVRKKSTKNKSPGRLQLPKYNTYPVHLDLRNDIDSSYATIIPSPEIPLFTDEHEGQFNNDMFNFVQEDKNTYHQHEETTSQFSFAPVNGLTSFHHNANGYPCPLEYCLVPDVALQQQQMYAEIMLHHEQHNITSAGSDSSSNQTSPITRTPFYPQQHDQYFPQGANASVNSGDYMLAGYEYQQNFMGGSVNPHFIQ